MARKQKSLPDLEGYSREQLREIARDAQKRIGSTPGRKREIVRALTLRICVGNLRALGIPMTKIQDLLAGKPGLPGSPEGIANKLSKFGGSLNIKLRRTGRALMLPDDFLGPAWMLEEQAINRARKILDRITPEITKLKR